MKKLCLVVAVAMLAALVVDANANVLPGALRLYWRDYDGAPNDSRVTAAPGETLSTRPPLLVVTSPLTPTCT